MDITLEEALKGKATIIKNNEYLESKAYVEPFVERMSKFTDNFIVKAVLPDQITKDKSVEDITYNRLWIQAVLPGDFGFDNHQEVVGMVYGLDVRKPIVKIYRGALNMACLNLCVFQPEELIINELEPQKPINFKNLTTIMEHTCQISEFLNKLKNTEFPREQETMERELGRWVNNSILRSFDTGYGKVKISTASVIDSYKGIFIDRDSEYYVKPEEDTSYFNIYNSFTNQICNKDKDIMNKTEKTLLLKSILEF